MPTSSVFLLASTLIRTNDRTVPCSVSISSLRKLRFFLHSQGFPFLPPLFLSVFGYTSIFKRVRKGYLATMRAVQHQDASDLIISSDFKELTFAAKKLANHALKLALMGFGASLLEWVASLAAIYLLILDRTHWRTNILTGLLIPYIFFSLPSLIFNIFRGEVGKWIAFIAVVLRLFFARRFPNWLEMPVALILLTVVAPSLFAITLRGGCIEVAICLAIACYLLQEHIRASGGFRNSFTRANGLSNTIGIIILLVYPAWALVIDLL